MARTGRSDTPGGTAAGADHAGIPCLGPEAGITFIEIAITLTFFAIAGLGLIGTMGYSIKQNAVNKETSVATLAARSALERLRATPFNEVYAEFNADKTDDPLGLDTGAGSYFEVEDLRKYSEDGVSGAGTIFFPEDKNGKLVENLDLPELGLPRDLNLDGTVDKNDRAADYRILPVMIVVRWRGMAGEREVRLHSVLRP
jgi:hypothetical protein